MGAYDDYSPGAAAAKWLHPDGSVTGAGGNQLLPPESARAADYATRSPAAAKWLLADGSVVSELPGGTEGDTGGGSGGGEGSPGGGSEPPAEVEVYLPVRATDALGGVAVLGDYATPNWRIDAAGTVKAPACTDAIAADIT